jgi:phosphotransferase system HPr (HPr) family protein
VDGHSLLSIITLGIAHGDEVVIDVAGEDAGRVADELAALLSSDLDAH